MMASDEMVVGETFATNQPRRLEVALFRSEQASRTKRAARCGDYRTRHVFGFGLAFSELLPGGIDLGNRSQQYSGIRVAGIVVYVRRITDFDEPAKIHDRHSIAYVSNDS